MEQQKKHLSVGIIGAGPAGLTAAYLLAQQNYEIVVLEASPHIGGLSRSISLWDQIVDLGPHRFYSSDATVNQVWGALLHGEFEVIQRLTRILYNGTFFSYPLSPWDLLRKLSPQELILCSLSYLWHRASIPVSGESYESWICRNFGRRLYEKFFKHYSEKLWGIPCDRLDADFAAQRIKGLSLLSLLQSFFINKSQQKRTLLDSFIYPNQGAGMVYQRMAEEAETHGAQIQCGCVVSTIERAQDRWILGTTNGKQIACDRIVSTMPLTQLIGILGESKGISVPEPVHAAALRLTFRNTILVYTEIENESLFPDQWVYVHQPELRMGRVTNFRNWSSGIRKDSKTTILCQEFWCDTEDPIWVRADAEIISGAISELYASSLIDRSETVARAHVVRVPKSYPIYERGYMQHVGVIEAFLKELPGFYAIGRNGSFKYNNQDHSIHMGILVSHIITGESDEDVWNVNRDYDSYLERKQITDVLNELSQQ